MEAVGGISGLAQIAGLAAKLAEQLTKFINDARSVGEEIAGLRSKSENLRSTFQLVKDAAERRKGLAEEKPDDKHDIETLDAVYTALQKSDHTVKKLENLIVKVEGNTDGKMKRGRRQARYKINETEIRRIEKKIADNNGYLRATLQCMEMSMIADLHREFRSGKEVQERIITEMIRVRNIVERKFQQEDQDDDESPNPNVDPVPNEGSTETSITVMSPGSDEEQHTLQTVQQCVEYLEIALKKLSGNAEETASLQRKDSKRASTVSSQQRLPDPDQKARSSSSSSPRSATSSDSERYGLDRDLSRELVTSAESGDVEKAKELLKNPLVGLEEPNSDGLTALLIAAKNDHEQIAKLLLEHDPKANVHARDNDKRTALHHAVSGDHGENEELILLLLEHGADINARKEELGRTPLHCCVWLRNEIGARVLVKHGADLEAKDKNGKTAAMVAVKHRRLDLVKMLQKAGAKFDMDDLENPSEDILYFLKSCHKKK